MPEIQNETQSESQEDDQPKRDRRSSFLEEVKAMAAVMQPILDAVQKLPSVDDIEKLVQLAKRENVSIRVGPVKVTLLADCKKPAKP